MSHSTSSIALGIDFGGTSVKFGVVQGHEVIAQAPAIATEDFQASDPLIDAIVYVIEDLRSHHPDISAIGENGVIKLVVRDKKNDTSNEYAIVVGETDQEFTFNFKVENIKIIPGAYDVVVSSKLLSQFTNTQHNLKYYIALEPDSTFG